MLRVSFLITSSTFQLRKGPITLDARLPSLYRRHTRLQADSCCTPTMSTTRSGRDVNELMAMARDKGGGQASEETQPPLTVVKLHASEAPHVQRIDPSMLRAGPLTSLAVCTQCHRCNPHPHHPLYAVHRSRRLPPSQTSGARRSAVPRLPARLAASPTQTPPSRDRRRRHQSTAALMGPPHLLATCPTTTAAPADRQVYHCNVSRRGGRCHCVLVELRSQVVSRRAVYCQLCCHFCCGRIQGTRLTHRLHPVVRADDQFPFWFL